MNAHPHTCDYRDLPAAARDIVLDVILLGPDDLEAACDEARQRLAAIYPQDSRSYHLSLLAVAIGREGC